MRFSASRKPNPRTAAVHSRCTSVSPKRTTGVDGSNVLPQGYRLKAGSARLPVQQPQCGD